MTQQDPHGSIVFSIPPSLFGRSLSDIEVRGFMALCEEGCAAVVAQAAARVRTVPNWSELLRAQACCTNQCSESRLLIPEGTNHA